MQTAFCPADILLPKETIDMKKWSVVACDQFTSEPDYWEKVEKTVGKAPSTYRMVLPEVYLEKEDVEERLESIEKSMEQYRKQDIFTLYKDAMIYVERTDSQGKIRAGIVGCIDLEEYDYHKGSQSVVRATEATVIERIPARIRVRKNAPVELPHIMILIDDPEKNVIEPLFGQKVTLPLLYDFDLMEGGGHLRGYLLEKEKQKPVLTALSLLGEKAHFQEKYHLENASVLLYAMGDGNHSLASAKEYYEQLKKEHPGEDYSKHPARYALAEIVNLHSPALEFEAIHRILTQINEKELLEAMTETLEIEDVTNKNLFQEEDSQIFCTVRQGERKRWKIHKTSSKLTVGSLQNFLDDYLKEHEGKIDYIHGSDVLEALSMEKDSVGFLLPDMAKEELFPTVILDGALPRKTFSMGHAQDKRYYTECRKIVED